LQQILGWQDNADQDATLAVLNNVLNNRVNGQRNVGAALYAARIQFLFNSRNVDKMLVLMQSGTTFDQDSMRREVDKVL
jgi:hypothetical protein